MFCIFYLIPAIFFYIYKHDNYAKLNFKKSKIKLFFHFNIK